MHGVEGHTFFRFKTLNFGPSGPATYFASPKISGSLGGWSSPHLPLKFSQATGKAALPAAKVAVDVLYV